MPNYLGDYRDLLRGFLSAGYRTIFFDELRGDEPQLILRHDVDFDCGLANDLSLLEDGLGVKSTWFFLLRSVSYNPFSARDTGHIRSIAARGHRIAIHFDPTFYDDVEAGFAEEKALFEGFFGMPLRIASVHRPNEFLKRSNVPLAGVEHTYQDKYFKDVAYISDSQGRFGHGHPFESEAWKARRPIHLLIHPIWWTIPEATSSVDLLDRFLERRIEQFRQHMADNCIPYRSLG